MANNTSRSTHKDVPADSCAATKQLGIRLPARLNDRLKAIARHESNNVSSVVRRLLTKALAHEAA